MEYVQETVAIAQGDTRFTIYISNEEGTVDFALQMLMWDPKEGALASLARGFPWVVGVSGGPYPSAKDAFEVAAAALASYQTAKNGVIVTVDNPCNEPFLRAADQETLLKQRGVNARVTVNGR